MRPQTIRVADRGYLVIPAKIRRRLKITKGTRLLLTESEDSLTLKPVPSFTEGLAGLTGTSFGSTGDQVQSWRQMFPGQHETPSFPLSQRGMQGVRSNPDSEIQPALAGMGTSSAQSKPPASAGGHIDSRLR